MCCSGSGCVFGTYFVTDDSDLWTEGIEYSLGPTVGAVNYAAVLQPRACILYLTPQASFADR